MKSNIEKLSVSVLDIDILSLDKTMMRFRDFGLKNIHIDIIDTSFTGNISFGLSAVKAFLNYHEYFKFSIHIMVKNPLTIINKILENMEINYPIEIMVHSNFEDILKISGITPVVAINPDQSVEDFKEVLPKFKNVLVMTVYPGFGGQKLKEDCVSKISQLKKLGLIVTVDGGINEGNINLLKEADSVVVGSAITRANNMEDAISKLTKNLE